MQYSYPAAGGNIGKIGETVNYTYDSLNRLATAGSSWGEAYTFDGFGNLTNKTPTAGSAPARKAVDPTSPP